MSNVPNYKIKAMREFADKLYKVLERRGFKIISPIQLSNAYYVAEGWSVNADIGNGNILSMRLYGDFPCITSFRGQAFDSNAFALSYDEVTYLRTRLESIGKSSIKQSGEIILKMSFSLAYQSVTVIGSRGTKVLLKG